MKSDSRFSSSDLTEIILLEISVSVVFEDWLDRILSKRMTPKEAVEQALRIRSLFEVRSEQTFDSNQWGKCTWSMLFRPFSYDHPWLPWSKLSQRTMACVLSLMKRNGTDGFNTVCQNTEGTRLDYKHFVHDERTNRYLDRGLGVIMLLEAFESQWGADFVNDLGITLTGSIPESVHELLFPYRAGLARENVKLAIRSR